MMMWESGNPGLSSVRAIPVVGIATVPRGGFRGGPATYGIIVKLGTPASIVARLAVALNRTAASDDMRWVMDNYDGSPAGPEWQSFVISRGGRSVAGAAPAPVPRIDAGVPDCNNPLNIQTIEQLDYCAQNSPKYDVPRR
jgi:hypothetical protein